MPFLTQGKTNVKYLFVVIILAILAGGLMVGISKMTECPCWWSSSQPQQALPIDETVNWQTYRDEEGQYEIKYPSDWEVVASSQWDEYSYKAESYPSVDFFSKEDSNIRFSIGVQTHWDVESKITEPSCVSQGEEIKAGEIGFYPTFSSFDWIGSGSHRIGFNEGECETLPLKNLISGGICVDANLKEYANHCEPTKVSDGGSYTITYPTDSTQYQFWLICGTSWSGKEGRNQCLQLFSKILSTFKFIEKPYSIIYPETKTSGDKTEYIIDTARFEVIKKKEVITTEPFSKEEPYTQYEWSFAAYNNGEKIYEKPLGEASPQSGEISAFEYKNNKYISVSDYSGGAHCCYSHHIFVLTDKELKLIDILYGDTGITTAGDKVYLSKLDDRFDYFYSSHVGSYFFERYFLVDNNKLIESNFDFQSDYLKKADDCDKKLNEGLQQNKYPELLFSNLICRVVNYLIVGENDKAWVNFEDYFNKIKANPKTETYNLKGKDAETIKAEIIDKMKDLL